MPICKKCNDQFPNRVEIDGKIRVISSRRYCLTCSPFGEHNTRKLCESIGSICEKCGKEYEYKRSKGHRKHLCNSCLTHLCQRKKKKKAVDHYGGKCTKCGYDRCIDALEFHHLRDKDESASYVVMKWSWERAKKELDKCQLVCSNCHREIHNEKRNSGID